MTHLLDVNVLIALGVADHKSHERVARWIERQRRDLTFELATTAITELGLLRIILELKGPIHQVYVLLEAIKSNRFVRFRFIADGNDLTRLPDWVKTAKQTTDGHLLLLAQDNGAVLATLDERIPGAYLIPL